MTKKYNVAIVGATGAVGEQLRYLLAHSKIPYDQVRLLASKRSAGQELKAVSYTHLTLPTTERV